jgi:hypothetical protein
MYERRGFWDGTEGRTCAVGCRDMPKERTAVHDKSEPTRIKDMVVDIHGEHNNSIFRLFTEWPIGRG